MELHRASIIIGLLVVDLSGADGNIYPVRSFRRQLVPGIQMYVCVPVDGAGLSGDKVVVSGGAIEVPDRVLEECLDPLRPRVQDNTTGTKSPGIVKSERCGLSEANPPNKFDVSERSVTRSKRMSLLAR